MSDSTPKLGLERISSAAMSDASCSAPYMLTDFLRSREELRRREGLRWREMLRPSVLEMLMPRLRPPMRKLELDWRGESGARRSMGSSSSYSTSMGWAIGDGMPRMDCHVP